MTRQPSATAPAARVFLHVWWVFLIFAQPFVLYEPYTGLLALALTFFLGGGWLVWRTVRRWRWHRAPIDRLLPLWAGVFFLSWAANFEAWREISIGVWFGLLYIGVWVIWQDMVANRVLSRAALMESLLIGGGVMIGLTLPEVPAVLQNWLSGNVRSRIVGPVGGSVLTASAFAVLIPAAFSLSIGGRSPLRRLLWATYAVLCLILLLMTQSRGGIIAAGVGMASVIGLRWISGGEGVHFLALWGRIPLVGKVLGGIGGIALVLMAGWVFSNRTLLISNQTTLDARPALYSTAITMFGERPLTGYGLFSYGRHYLRLGSLPPDEMQNQAHNIILNIAAELGGAGLILGAFSVVWWAGAMRRNLVALSGLARTTQIGAIGACIGFFAHHQFDVSAIVPVGAILGLIPLVAATAPIDPRPLPARWQPVRTGLIVGLGAALLVTGLWDRRVALEAVHLQIGPLADDSPLPYAEQAALLDRIIAADPGLPAYRLWQAGLYGLAAQGGDREAARKGIEAYQGFNTLHPYFSPAWANLAMLQWAVGEQSAAIESMRHAAELSPRHWSMWVNLGLLEEAHGQTEAALASYARALRDYPKGDLTLYPIWDESPIRQQAAAPRRMEGYTPWAQAALALRAGDAGAARHAFEKVPVTENALYDVTALAIAYAQGRRTDFNTLAARFSQKKNTFYDYEARLFGSALIALAKEDRAQARAGVAQLRRLMRQRPAAVPKGVYVDSFNQIYNLRLPLWQDRLLPSVFSPSYAPLLHPLTDWLEALLQ